jgi:hypothetical protein
MIILPAYLDGLRTLKDKSLKITFDTNELTPQDLLGLMESMNSFGYLAFKTEPFKQEEKQMIESLKSDYGDGQKSSSQRLRSVLYLNWKKNSEGFDTSVKHYEHWMEKIINGFKSKLD